MPEPRKGFRTPTALPAAVAAAAALTLAAPLAPSATATTPARPATAAPGAGTTLIYDKNPSAPTDSRLSVYRDGKLQATYRAGSGIGVKDDCVRNKGWMPDGNWRIKLKSRTYDGNVIKGHAVYLQDMKCSKGTVTRTEMFLHSEMNRDGSSGRSEARRWDGPSDYRSNGCVKLNPTDIKKMFRLLDRIGWPTHLRVVP
ncbi:MULTISPECIES: L,D-transpeptidase [Streptomyces]|uniref:L,D-transpeptidase n=1 Tax=Streptomyces rochei TaxID=1928 RepID=A0ABW7E4F5_STRRO|nr:L,D-transpeptidase [Streptomyces sp. MBT28]